MELQGKKPGKKYQVKYTQQSEGKQLELQKCQEPKSKPLIKSSVSVRKI